ncbi:hypothetical protein [Cohnella sp. GCM10012308]|uniref:hypothetical protein n=1 Tax=Cohnella sp. GCM10012308 TaxID=3317329 RepID=UPI00361CACE0
MLPIKWRSQEGSALLLVIFIMIVFTMLGLALMGATIGGAKRAETRENDVQSLHLAEMSLNEAAASVALLFKDKEDINLDSLKSDLESIKLTSTEGQVGGTSDIVKFKVNENQGINVGGDVTKQFSITVQAQAEVNGVVRTLEQVISLDSYPEFLQYGLGSEQNVYLNGAPYLFGKLYSGLKLYVKNQADYRYNMSAGDMTTFLHTDTAFPTIGGSGDNKGNLFLQDGSSLVATDRLGNNEPTVVPLDNADELKKTTGLTINDIQYRDRKKFVSVSVEESFLDKVAEAVGDTKVNRNLPSLYPALPKDNVTAAAKSFLANNLLSRAGLSYISLPQKPTALAPDADDDAIAGYNDKMNAYRAAFIGTMPAETAIYNGDLTIDGAELQKISFNEKDKRYREPNADPNAEFMKSNWLIVNGDLTIDNPDPENDLEVRANILVAGNVFIEGKVKMDATIIALGESTIQDAEISGLEDKELLLISKGKILVNRFDSFNTVNQAFIPDGPYHAGNPKVLQAFLYTDSDAELYGVGSAFWIKGGFFAKGDLLINAVLGNTNPDSSNTQLEFDRINSGVYPAEDRLKSRFIVQYNSKIYDDQNVGLPRVKQINVNIGKKRLVPLGSKANEADNES